MAEYVSFRGEIDSWIQRHGTPTEGGYSVGKNDLLNFVDKKLQDLGADLGSLMRLDRVEHDNESLRHVAAGYKGLAWRLLLPALLEAMDNDEARRPLREMLGASASLGEADDEHGRLEDLLARLRGAGIDPAGQAFGARVADLRQRLERLQGQLAAALEANREQRFALEEARVQASAAVEGRDEAAAGERRALEAALEEVRVQAQAAAAGHEAALEEARAEARAEASAREEEAAAGHEQALEEARAQARAEAAAREAAAAEERRAFEAALEEARAQAQEAAAGREAALEGARAEAAAREAALEEARAQARVQAQEAAAGREAALEEARAAAAEERRVHEAALEAARAQAREESTAREAAAARERQAHEAALEAARAQARAEAAAVREAAEARAAAAVAARDEATGERDLLLAKGATLAEERTAFEVRVQNLEADLEILTKGEVAQLLERIRFLEAEVERLREPPFAALLPAPDFEATEGHLEAARGRAPAAAQAHVGHLLRELTLDRALFASNAARMEERRGGTRVVAELVRTATREAARAREARRLAGAE
jgi:chemotaxis protein histidine kinase CheA